MVQSLSQVEAQIAKLQRQADALKAKEVREVVGRIRKAIKHYSLEPADLFGGPSHRGSKAVSSSPRPGPTAGRKRRGAGVPKYREEATGRSWTGFGRKPQWISEGLAAGKSLEDFLISASASTSTATAPATERPRARVRTGRKRAVRKAPATVATPTEQTQAAEHAAE
ncbi:MAG TPA: H-NS histone family protein [Burkholderiaceae bacterium]|nr:H-NS histone family protein [Burkholderiaceae bacterium]